MARGGCGEGYVTKLCCGKKSSGDKKTTETIAHHVMIEAKKTDHDRGKVHKGIEHSGQKRRKRTKGW